jgi:hypothetical protein
MKIAKTLKNSSKAYPQEKNSYLPLSLSTLLGESVTLPTPGFFRKDIKPATEVFHGSDGCAVIVIKRIEPPA